MDIENNNTVQPTSTPQQIEPTVESKPKTKNIRLIAIIIVISLLLLGGGAYLAFNAQKNKNTASNNVSVSPTTSPIPSVAKETSSQDSLSFTAQLKIPFIRNETVYLYEDGKEKVIDNPQQKSTTNSCYGNAYPFLSPNGKYLAYISYMGSEPGMGGCYVGMLKVVNLKTGEIKTTHYKTRYFSWNSSNQIVFNQDQERGQGPQAYTTKKIFYDPSSEKETVFSTLIDQDKSTYAETMVSGEFPYDTNKLISYKNQKYYLVDKLSGKETFLFDKSQVQRFLDWSPGGRYAIFESTKKATQVFDAIELVVDTTNTSAQPKEITVGRGGADGDFSTGRKWYFEKGFVAYCRQDIYFVDGSKSLQLTNDRGGGCHNEEGFVATSPNGEYAFVKFKDRFELHTKNGEKQVVKEVKVLPKGRGTPKNLIWLNNDYMIIFYRTEDYNNGTSDNPTIYLFDRKANTVKPLIENAYLRTALPY